MSWRKSKTSPYGFNRLAGRDLILSWRHVSLLHTAGQERWEKLVEAGCWRSCEAAGSSDCRKTTTEDFGFSRRVAACSRIHTKLGPRWLPSTSCGEPNRTDQDGDPKVTLFKPTMMGRAGPGWAGGKLWARSGAHLSVLSPSVAARRPLGPSVPSPSCRTCTAF